ncbi:phosphatidate cytidylyltransferase [Nitrosococcus oceani]|uniref:Phosphatidate cytidylyltransferase n=2 Tax=Nitrosococcus oceani TaxID=1229 RepID=Q3JAE8_NITOC|nr:phosphatidate cytidylyltransferase [Nitrosococcus oceani]KFI19311.1 phosphatidate cytidylyltransferase [Nitrosococcus oceani C-27]ABA58198.1 Phosphatidate cytidylyltransferase [Nitrosococcus oceani ATCC 19707]EDZ68442.1 phosphatidate cytidylyltransferase [Nitrosococcus oceani AFC27]KFI22625.1 phosphatidate cytidylyltransferase [Nitrosococcus oceani]GEM20418.1 phosphatidate cytidylyltransferase [Nitrosococcus oceani]
MDWLDIHPAALQALGGILGVLAIANLIVFIIRGRLSKSLHHELVSRIQSWWLMFAVFAIAMAINRTGSLIFFAFVSFMALKEYLSLIPSRRADRRVMFWAYLTIPAQYLLVGYKWYGMFIILIPVYAFLLLPMRMVLVGETRNFLRAAGTLHWGVMAMVFSISHVAYLLVLPEQVNPAAGGAGLVLYLVFLTQFNDVAQYCWGKLLGRRKILPSVSPGKTVEGLIGGIATTIVLSWSLASWLTPLNVPQSVAAGALIGIAGFVGDVTISALKRDLGVKDSGSLLPGHGGILDRIDSLIYTAPLFFHFIYYLHG